MKSETVQTQRPNLIDRQTILIVDDERAMRDLLVSILDQETPYGAFAVSDASQALDAVQGIRPRLFLLDYGLPGINGLQLHDLLHAVKGLESVPTLMMSVSIPSLEAMHDRQITYLSKPFDLDILLSVITNLLSGNKREESGLPGVMPFNHNFHLIDAPSIQHSAHFDILRHSNTASSLALIDL